MARKFFEDKKLELEAKKQRDKDLIAKMKGELEVLKRNQANQTYLFSRVECEVDKFNGKNVQC